MTSRIQETQMPLIPPSDVVRTELARVSRERRRLEALLRLSLKAETDCDYVEALRAGAPCEAPLAINDRSR